MTRIREEEYLAMAYRNSTIYKC